jgi:hypothetical protein
MSETTEVTDVSNSLTAFCQDVFGVKVEFEDEVAVGARFDGLILNFPADPDVRPLQPLMSANNDESAK